MQDRANKQGQGTKLQSFLESIKQKECIIDQWDEELWMIMVEKAIVHRDKSITFKYYNGKNNDSSCLTSGFFLFCIPISAPIML